MRRLLFWIGQILLSVPWFIQWPITVWNWAARAHHVPLPKRQPLFGWCMGGAFSLFVLILAFVWGSGNIMQLLALAGLYVGSGIRAVYDGIALSREYRHLREVSPQLTTR